MDFLLKTFVVQPKFSRTFYNGSYGNCSLMGGKKSRGSLPIICMIFRRKSIKKKTVFAIKNKVAIILDNNKCDKF